MQPEADRYRDRVERAVAFLRERCIRPRVVCTLGSGLGDAAPDLDGEVALAYEEIPGFPVSTAPGHGGYLRYGAVAGLPVAILDGRFHYYEGYTTREATLPLRVLALLGARDALFVSAAGGLDTTLSPGSLLFVRDHINLIPDNPLRGPNIDEWGERFVDMSHVYDAGLLAAARAAARDAGCRQPAEGIYVAVPGPSLETPAETRMLRLLGADAVGMSTVPEVIVARHAGMRVLVVAVIVNVNDPDCMQAIRVDEVLAVAGRAAAEVRRLLGALLAHLGAGDRGSA